MYIVIASRKKENTKEQRHQYSVETMQIFRVFSQSHLLIAAISFHYYSYTSWAFQAVPPSVSSYHVLNAANGRFIDSGSTSLLRMDMISIDLDDIESTALRASENWDTAVTPFLNQENAKLVGERLASRADVGYIQVGGLPSSLRTRFVMSNPDLEIDAVAAEAEYCVLLCVDNINTASMGSQSPWPHVLTKIGVELENVGDVVVEDEKAYMAVMPGVAKQCCRLLPKELRGVGITVSVVEPGDYLPYDGTQQDMHLGKLDKRALKYK